MNDIGTLCNQVGLTLKPLSNGSHHKVISNLPGCFGDGETREAAIVDAEKAIVEWADEYAKMGREVPRPGIVEAEIRSNREAEIKFITHLRDRLKAKEADYDILDSRLNDIESEMQHLLDILENVEAWERFHLITKSTKPKQLELPCSSRLLRSVAECQTLILTPRFTPSIRR